MDNHIFTEHKREGACLGVSSSSVTYDMYDTYLCVVDNMSVVLDIRRKLWLQLKCRRMVFGIVPQ